MMWQLIWLTSRDEIDIGDFSSQRSARDFVEGIAGEAEWWENLWINDGEGMLPRLMWPITQQISWK